MRHFIVGNHEPGVTSEPGIDPIDHLTCREFVLERFAPALDVAAKALVVAQTDFTAAARHGDDVGKRKVVRGDRDARASAGYGSHSPPPITTPQICGVNFSMRLQRPAVNRWSNIGMARIVHTDIGPPVDRRTLQAHTEIYTTDMWC